MAAARVECTLLQTQKWWSSDTVLALVLNEVWALFAHRLWKLSGLGDRFTLTHYLLADLQRRGLSVWISCGIYNMKNLQCESVSRSLVWGREMIVWFMTQVFWYTPQLSQAVSVTTELRQSCHTLALRGFTIYAGDRLLNWHYVISCNGWLWHFFFLTEHDVYIFLLFDLT